MTIAIVLANNAVDIGGIIPNPKLKIIPGTNAAIIPKDSVSLPYLIIKGKYSSLYIDFTYS